jgi:hypothetical protein
MANKDLLKQAIAEAKSVREAAIANAKEALEETLTPHLKDMLAAKLQEMEDKDSKDEEVVNEVEEDIEEAKDDKKDEAVDEQLTEIEPVGEAEEEAEDDSEESEDDAPIEEPADDIEDIDGEEDAIDGDEDLKDLSVDQFKDMIRDIIAQEMGAGDGEELPADDMDGGDIEGMGDEAPIEEPELDGGSEEEEIDLDELLAELEAISEEEAPVEEAKKDEEMEEGKKDDKKEESVEEVIEGPTANEVDSKPENSEKNVNATIKEELKEAMDTIESLRADLQEVNLLNSKLLYVNKIFKANNLTESQKVNVIAAFDRAENVKEVKLVFETVSESDFSNKKENVTENKLKGMASKATGTTAAKPGVITEANGAIHRMQVLAGIKPRQF